MAPSQPTNLLEGREYGWGSGLVAQSMVISSSGSEAYVERVLDPLWFGHIDIDVRFEDRRIRMGGRPAPM